MICPTCGTHVPDDATVCPACHARLQARREPAQREGVFCKNCGALVPPGRITCPSCGFPLDDELVESVIEHEAGEAKPKPAAKRAKVAQPESVIPARPKDGYRSASPKEHMPHYRVVLTAALCALVAVGGTVLAITQPWNPNANVRHATTDADTSMAGYPGEVTYLSGQDKTATQEETTGTDPYFEEVSSFYDTLGTISSKADDNETLLRDIVAGKGGDVTQGSEAAKQLSLDLSNAMSDFSQKDMSSSPYEDECQTLNTLASYLRNRLDAMTSAWDSVKSASDVTSAASKVDALLGDDSSGSSAGTWKGLFSQGYDDAKPQEASSDNSDGDSSDGSDDSSSSQG